MTDAVSTDRGARARRPGDDKETDMVHVEDGKPSTMTAEEEFVSSFSEKQKKKLLRKMDFHTIPILISLYCVWRLHQ